MNLKMKRAFHLFQYCQHQVSYNNGRDRDVKRSLPISYEGETAITHPWAYCQASVFFCAELLGKAANLTKLGINE